MKFNYFAINSNSFEMFHADIEVHVIAWSRIAESLGQVEGLPVQSLSPLCSQTLVCKVRIIEPTLSASKFVNVTSAESTLESVLKLKKK